MTTDPRDARLGAVETDTPTTPASSATPLHDSLARLLATTPAAHTTAILATREGVVAGVALRVGSGWTISADGGVERAGWFADLAVVKSW